MNERPNAMREAAHLVALARPSPTVSPTAVDVTSTRRVRRQMAMSDEEGALALLDALLEARSAEG